MLCVDGRTGDLADGHFSELPGLLKRGDLLVVNDTQVIPARLLGRKQTGGRIEVLIERITAANRALVHIKASKSPRAGTSLEFAAGGAEVLGRSWRTVRAAL